METVLLEPATNRDPLRSLRAEAESLACSLAAARTPALLVDEATVDANIEATIAMIGSADRWRAHCKTAKSARTMIALRGHGVRRFKASTTAEVACLLEIGASDVLFAITAVGPAQHELVELAKRYPEARLNALLDSLAGLESWKAGPIGFFLDVDTGTGRSGVHVERPAEGRTLIDEALARGFELAGLHHYDGHLSGLSEAERVARTSEGLSRLSDFASELGVELPEVVTGGSHTFLPALDFEFPESIADRVSVSPGTVVYCDLRSLELLGDVGLRPAVGVLTRVVSAPSAKIATVDAGLTAIQTDAGLPHAAVSGRSDAKVGTASQEHLSIYFPSEAPAVGDLLVLVPRHVDTTVAQFDGYVALDEHSLIGRHPVTARHHGELLRSSGQM